MIIFFVFFKGERTGHQFEKLKMAGGGDVDEEEQLRESLKNHPHLTLDELREFKELFNLVRRHLLEFSCCLLVPLRCALHVR